MSALAYPVAARPAIISPVPWSMLPNSSQVTFQWTNGGRSDVTEYWIWAGLTPGTYNILTSGSMTPSTFSRQIPGIPADSGNLYVRLWFRVSGISGWYYSDFSFLTYRALPQLLSPNEGSTLPGPTATVMWTPNQTTVSEWWLYAGSSLNAFNYFNGSIGPTYNQDISGLPTDGSDVYFQLWYKEANVWKVADNYVFKAATGGVITSLSDHGMITPAYSLGCGAYGVSPTAYEVGVSSHQFWLGSSITDSDLFYGPETTSTFWNSLEYPTDGRMVYVWLRWKVGGVWFDRKSVYNSLIGIPALTKPTAGSQLGKNPQSNYQHYQWLPAAPQASGIHARYLYVGSAFTGQDAFNGWLPTNFNEAFVSFSPSVNDGRTLHNTFWYKVSKQWMYVSTTCIAPKVTQSDQDGDGVFDAWDHDIDHDGMANENDPDVNNDGIPNNEGYDDDGDGFTDEVDDTPNGPTPPLYHEITVTYKLTGTGTICVHEPGDPIVWKITKGEGQATMMLRRGMRYYAQVSTDANSSGSATVNVNNGPWILLDHETSTPSTTINAGAIDTLELDLLPIEVRDISNNQLVTDTAWIKGHKTSGGGEQAEMPKLESRVLGLPSSIQVDWKLENRYPRRNGRDDLNIPGGDTAEPGIFVAGDQPWKIHEQYITLGVDQRFFGGDVKVKCRLHGLAGMVGEGEVSFKIRGENPDDARCKAYIIANQGTIWYAWAIAKHESADTNGFYYNQFATGLLDGSAGAHGAKGEPFFAPSEGDGWGLFQRDSASGLPVTTKEAWGWDSNMRGFVSGEYPEHLLIANNYVDSVERNSPNKFEEPAFTIKGRVISGRHVLALTWYNGPQGRSNSQLLHFDGSKPLGQRWSLGLPNAPGKNQPYVHEVMDQYNGG